MRASERSHRACTHTVRAQACPPLLLTIRPTLSSRSMDLAITRDRLRDELYRICDAQGMRDNVHIRLMVTRGLKSTPYQSPKVTIGDPTST